ncbi:MAG: sodium:proton antiporter, partial [Rhodospirillales bacterium]|nr:sodium:proton antiporter [Rhodospirillales bacterium]
MVLFELIILLLLAGALLVAWARRIGAPYPALLSLAGAAAALIPGTPALNLDPQLTLALFVAPTLLDAAFDASPRDMRENWLPIGALAVIVVGLTVAAVAILAHAVVPGMSWAAAIALGAIVAPPDASAATAVLRQLNPPHRLMVILEGESLLNDAAALLIYRIAVAAAAGDAVIGWTLAPIVAGTVLGGGLLGWAMARLWLLIPVQRAALALSVLLQFLGTFAVWILADRIGVSAIMTVVVYAMVLARRSPLRTPARYRIASYAVWDVVVFVLNVLAFVLIGLQLKPILLRLDGAWFDYLALAAGICGLTVLVRAGWVFSYVSVRRLALRLAGPARKEGMLRPTFPGATLVSWCGMRGIVTLASALALPEAFPARDLILFCAFAVVIVTLVVQGLTLRPLMRILPIPADGS